MQICQVSLSDWNPFKSPSIINNPKTIPIFTMNMKLVKFQMRVRQDRKIKALQQTFYESLLVISSVQFRPPLYIV